MLLRHLTITLCPQIRKRPLPPACSTELLIFRLTLRSALFILNVVRPETTLGEISNLMTLAVSHPSINNSERNWAQQTQVNVKTETWVPSQPAFKGTGGWLFFCLLCRNRFTRIHPGSARAEGIQRLDPCRLRSNRFPTGLFVNKVDGELIGNREPRKFES